MRTEATRLDKTTENEWGERRRKARFWVPLVWAAVPTLLLVVLSVSFASAPLPDGVGWVLFFTVLLPAAWICQLLGFREFNFPFGNTIPSVLLLSVVIALVYLYCLVFVMVGRGVLRLVG